MRAQALERMLAAGQCPASSAVGSEGAAGACTAVPKRPRRAGAALTLVSGAGHDALALADLTKVRRCICVLKRFTLRAMPTCAARAPC